MGIQNNLVETIKNLLVDAVNASGKENKTRIVEEIFTIINQNKWVLNKYPKFKITVSKKLKEFDQVTDCPCSQYLAKKFRNLM
uniref:Uncharacterized protein n=1 Tax=Marseillevirus LCMAC102 TaxID=2506603 RepID=A0A481YTU2_9VIRU|nr:MAG: uncharacterized protein LCMAC102_03040 [Marseillevirus LCMAC102]